MITIFFDDALPSAQDLPNLLDVSDQEKLNDPADLLDVAKLEDPADLRRFARSAKSKFLSDLHCLRHLLRVIISDRFSEFSSCNRIIRLNKHSRSAGASKACTRSSSWLI